MTINSLSSYYQSASRYLPEASRAATIAYELYAMSGLEANSVEMAIRSMVVTLYANSAQTGDYAAAMSEAGFNVQKAFNSLFQGEAVNTTLALGSALYNCYSIKLFS